MPSRNANTFVQPAIRIVFAGLGSAVAGPLGAAIGGFTASALGIPAAHLARDLLEKFGDDAAKKLLDTGADSLANKLKDTAPNLQATYREAFRQSLASIRANAFPEYAEWFDHWDVALRALSFELKLNPIHLGQLNQDGLDLFFRNTLERLDAQGRARRRFFSSFVHARSVPGPLIDRLRTELPGFFKQHFESLIVTDEYSRSWKEAELLFQSATLGFVQSIKVNTDKISGMARKIDELYRLTVDNAERDNRISSAEARALPGGNGSRTMEEEIPRTC